MSYAWGQPVQTDEHKAAASSDGQFFWGSSYIGDGPDVCAPGSWSYTTDMTGSQGYNDGSGDIDADYFYNFCGDFIIYTKGGGNRGPDAVH